ncbi:MAG: hypothetical protein KH208_15305 [Desulfovibrio sp.]|uniref:hypothetical protein n=1 Tax=Desulfovibrio sp. TaxID=885 RepID=UPI0025BE09E2|nr:hypothetical protein [Desulfovibrio sp.]MBS6831189.1 hypothetical protein [Desulfovibrio sp.]
MPQKSRRETRGGFSAHILLKFFVANKPYGPGIRLREEEFLFPAKKKGVPDPERPFGVAQGAKSAFRSRILGSGLIKGKK